MCSGSSGSLSYFETAADGTGRRTNSSRWIGKADGSMDRSMARSTMLSGGSDGRTRSRTPDPTSPGARWNETMQRLGRRLTTGPKVKLTCAPCSQVLEREAAVQPQQPILSHAGSVLGRPSAPSAPSAPLAASPQRVVCRAPRRMRQRRVGYFTARALIRSSCVLSALPIQADVCVNKKKSTSGVTSWLRRLEKRIFRHMSGEEGKRKGAEHLPPPRPSHPPPPNIQNSRKYLLF